MKETFLFQITRLAKCDVNIRNEMPFSDTIMV